MGKAHFGHVLRCTATRCASGAWTIIGHLGLLALALLVALPVLSTSTLGQTVIYDFTMDTNPGWSTEGQWEFGPPQGNEGDPPAAHTGVNVYGYNLAGAYANNMPEYFLTTKALNFTGYTGVTLAFSRWLGVEAASYDHAQIQVSQNGTDWVTIWQHSGNTLEDTSWQAVSYDISAVADGQPVVYVRWGMGPTDGSIRYAGWNIDDVRFTGTSTDNLVVLPQDGLAGRGYEGGPFDPPSQAYTLSNLGTGPLDWTAAASESWFTVEPSSGTLAAGAGTSVTVSLTAAATALAPGNYLGSVTFQHVGGASLNRTVTLQVLAIPGVLEVEDSIAPIDDLLMPFGDLTVGLQQLAPLTIKNTDATHSLVISNIILHLYWEGFDNGLASGWEPDEPANWTVVAGEYRAQVDNDDVMTSTYGGHEWADLSVQAECRRAGSMLTGAGLALRASADFDAGGAGSAYMFQISTDGYFSVLKQVNGAAPELLQDWTFSPAIRSGVNVLLASAQGTSLRFYINGTPVWSGADTSLTSGRIGLLGSTYVGFATTHYFDNVAVGDPVLITGSLTADQQWYNEHPMTGGTLTTTSADWTRPFYPGGSEGRLKAAAVTLATQQQGAFRIEGVPTLPVVVPAGQQMSFNVVFDPPAPGAHQAVIRITSNDIDDPSVTVALTGEGLADPLSVVPGTGLAFSGHPNGPFTPASGSYQLSNISGSPVTWSATTTSWLEVSSSGGTLNPGAEATVVVTLKPGATPIIPGIYSGNVTFTDETTTVTHVRNVTLEVFTSAQLVVSPTSIAVTNIVEGTSTRTLHISNGAGADAKLSFSLTLRETAQAIFSASTQEAIELAPPPANFRRVPQAKYAPQELLVRFSSQLTHAQSLGVMQAMGVTELRRFKAVPGLALVKLPPKQDMDQALAAFSRTAGVISAEPNYLIKADQVFTPPPNDPYYLDGTLWGLRNTGQGGGTPGADVHVLDAWAVSHGGEVRVAVLDTGVDYNHPDLSANIWTNPGEIAGNNMDDDGNGYVDDVHGYDFVNRDGNPMDDNYHGTHVAGTIGAVGNNGLGVVGVCWQVKIIALKCLDAEGSGDTADAITAIGYAIDQGARVINASWGGGPYSSALQAAIAAAGSAGIAFVAAAGNDGADNDVTPHYPASYTLPNIIAVMATDRNDARSVWGGNASCFGLTSVDLGAPGTAISSTVLGSSYALANGTSMAAPYVSGACALLWSVNSSLTVADVKSALLSTVDPTLPGLCVSGGRLNIGRALGEVGVSWLTANPTSGTEILPGGSQDITLTFSAAGLAPGRYEAEIVIASNDREHPTTLVPVVLTVLRAQEYIFYNNSKWDGYDEAANAADDGAIAPDKRPLLPGQTATFANYTSYDKGINGIMIDLELPSDGGGTLSPADDFDFKVGNSNTPGTWVDASTLPTVTIRAGAGLSGSDRVTLIWPAGSIKKQWLQVTVLATANTGLPAPVVFYFGNAIGECGNSTADANVNVTDVVQTRANQSLATVPITSNYDYSRDGKVNVADVVLCRANQVLPSAALKLITVP